MVIVDELPKRHGPLGKHVHDFLRRAFVRGTLVVSDLTALQRVTKIPQTLAFRGLVLFAYLTQDLLN